MRAYLLSAIAITVAATVPSTAQTIVDTFRQLRTSVKQLSSGRRPPDAEAGRATSAGPSPTTTADDASMAPPSVLADDSSDTRLEAVPLVVRQVATFDIRGLKLGMSPREVGRIAGRQGFHRRWNDLLLTTGSFEVEAARLANRTLNRPIDKSSKVQLGAVQGVDAAGDELKCQFALEPAGPRLSRIEYRAKLNGTTEQEAFEALERKYGPAMRPEAITGVRKWSNARGPIDNAFPSLIAVVDDGRMSLTLQQSVDDLQAAQRRLEQRAQQLAAERGGGVKF